MFGFAFQKVKAENKNKTIYVTQMMGPKRRMS